jgi:hypothetical protein
MFLKAAVVLNVEIIKLVNCYIEKVSLPAASWCLPPPPPPPSFFKKEEGGRHVVAIE